MYQLTLFLQLGQQLIEYGHLAAVDDKMEVSGVRWARLRAIKQVRVIAALPELHQHIQQTHLIHLPCRVQDIDVLHQDFSIPVRKDEGSIQSKTMLASGCLDVYLPFFFPEMMPAYHSLCILLSPTYILTSFLGSRDFSTSALIRLSRKGRNTYTVKRFLS